MPRSCRSLASMLVNTVTAISSGAVFSEWLQGFTCSGHHTRAAGERHDVDHPDAQLCRSGDGTRRGIRDIVELQIEENLKTALVQVTNKLRPSRGSISLPTFRRRQSRGSIRSTNASALSRLS